MLFFGNTLIVSLLRNELNIDRHDEWWVISALVQILVGYGVTLILLNRSFIVDGNAAQVRLGLPRLEWLNQFPRLQKLLCRSVPFSEIHSIQLLNEEVRSIRE